MRLPAFCRPSVPRRGVSLVEALVAMAVMSIGMLALVGVQGTMRLNSDLARQRTEATRIASEEIERVRSFTSLGVVAGTPGVSYDEIVSRDVAGYQLPGDTANTSYQVQRTVRPDPSSGQKLITVRVRWTDRTNQAQTVTLDSSISASPPVLSAMLVVPHRESAVSRGRGRHISIPDAAVPVSGDSGRSQFTPPGSTGVVWYFDNLTGAMQVSVNGVLTPATLVSGTVRFHLIGDVRLPGEAAEYPLSEPPSELAAGPAALTLTPIRNNDSSAGATTSAYCYSGRDLTATPAKLTYFCAVVTTHSLGWGGQLDLALANGSFAPGEAATASNRFKSCRYTDDKPDRADPNADYTVNSDHPRTYCMKSRRSGDTIDPHAVCTGDRVRVNLINQNFLVVRGDQNCPSEFVEIAPYVYEYEVRPIGRPPDNPLIRANTRQHQPAP